MKYKAVFFDFDGTLMDTSEGIINSGLRAMDAVGIPIPENAEYRKFIGPPLRDSFRITFGITDSNTLEELVKRYRVFHHEKGIYEATFYPYILDVIKTLKEKGYKVGVASMKLQDVIQRSCDIFHITEYLDYCGGMIDDQNDTKASIVERGCTQLNIPVDECVLVGDTEIDRKGALEAGAGFIKVGWGFGYLPSDEGVINDARDILNLV